MTIESANPARHPPFQEQLLDRELLKMPCPHCDAEHRHYDRFTWIDLPGLLCVVVLHESERPDWPELEIEALRELSVPLREEGPPSSARSARRSPSASSSGSRSSARRSCAASTTSTTASSSRSRRTWRTARPWTSAEPGMNLTFKDARTACSTSPGSCGGDGGATEGAAVQSCPGSSTRPRWVNVGRSQRAPLREDFAPPVPRR